MALHLAKRSYQSSRVLDWFLEGIPELDEKVIGHLHEQEKWKNFKNSCTGGKGKGKGKDMDETAPTGSSSNEIEFMDLVECITGLNGIERYFKRQHIEGGVGFRVMKANGALVGYLTRETTKCGPGIPRQPG